jgi:hypothetical protein
MAKHVWKAPTEGLEGHLFAHNAVRSSRQFLQANSEGKKSFPTMAAWNGAIDNVYANPGDLKLYQGAPAPKGRRASK